MKRPVVMRILLGLGSVCFILVYLFTAAVAFATSGTELLRMPMMWYALIVPLAYAVFCVAGALFGFGFHLSRKAALVVHLVVLPSVFISFMCLGYLLPVLALLWRSIYVGADIQQDGENRSSQPEPGEVRETSSRPSG